MTINIYATKDELTNRFMAPSYFEDDAIATRQFRSNINNITLWKENASDFSLWKLGTYDDATGTIIGITPEKIIGGRACVE